VAQLRDVLDVRHVRHRCGSDALLLVEHDERKEMELFVWQGQEEQDCLTVVQRCMYIE
jgi:hypothetical protein